MSREQSAISNGDGHFASIGEEAGLSGIESENLAESPTCVKGDPLDYSSILLTLGKGQTIP